MDREDRAVSILKWLAKTIWKLCLILLWGTLRLVELLLAEINKWLKKIIH